MRIPDSISPRVRSLAEETLDGFPSDDVLVATSGGPDSTALAFLAAVRGRATLCHVNHHLGPQAQRFENAVRELGQRWDVPIRVAHVDPDRIVNGSLGLEAEARNARYRAICELSCSPILTAHTAHDRLDTVLMRLVQGTGVDALDGPREQVTISGRAVHRPMLNWYEEDVAELLDALRLTAVQDPGNLDPARLRNMVRPVARALSQIADRDVLARSLGLIASDAERLREHDDALLARVSRAVDGETWIAGCAFSRLPSSTRATVIHRLMRNLGVRGSMRICREGADLVPGARARGAGVLIEHCETVLRVARAPGDRLPAFDFEQRIDLSAEATRTPLGVLRAADTAPLDAPDVIALDRQALSGCLRVRVVTRNDRFVPFGRTREAAVVECLAKDGWSECQRGIALILADDLGPIAVLGGRRGSRAPLTEGCAESRFRWIPWTGGAQGADPIDDPC